LKTLAAVLGSVALLGSSILYAETKPSESLTDNPVFLRDCAKCHGKTAEGRHFGGPSLRSNKVTAASVDDLRAMITNGKGRMPRYGAKLSADEIDKLVEQIKAFAPK
jgi:cytochrome c553